MKYTIFTFSFIILLLPNLGLSAWDFSPNVKSAAYFTDNVELDSSSEDSELVFELSPGFTLTRVGGRVQADVNYVLQNFFYADESDRDETFHQLDAFTSIELLRDRFFVDATSTISRQIVDPDAPSPSSDIIDSRNQTDRRSLYVNPYWREGIGDFAELFLSYSKGYLDYDDSRVIGRTEDSETDRYEAALGNLNDYHRLGWEAFYERADEEGEDTDLTDTFERYGLNVEIPVNAKLTLLGVGGNEENDFDRQFLVDVPEGEYWEAGFRWSLNPNNIFEFKYGDRDFGKTRFLSWNRVGGKLELNVSFKEDLETDASVFFDRDFNIAPTNNFEQDAQALTNEIFVRERLDIEAILNIARGNITLTIFDEERKLLESPDQEDSTGGAIVWDWQFASRTSLISELRYTRREPTERNDEFDRYELGALVEREIGGRGSKMFVELGHTRRESDASIREYDESFIGTGVFLSF